MLRFCQLCMLESSPWCVSLCHQLHFMSGIKRSECKVWLCNCVLGLCIVSFLTLFCQVFEISRKLHLSNSWRKFWIINKEMLLCIFCNSGASEFNWGHLESFLINFTLLLNRLGEICQTCCHWICLFITFGFILHDRKSVFSSVSVWGHLGHEAWADCKFICQDLVVLLALKYTLFHNRFWIETKSD